MLIANPTAGQGRVRWMAGFIQSALERHGAEVTLVLTGGLRDAAEAAEYVKASGRFDRIVVAGGDGTINQVVTQLVGTDIPMAILPVGTANSLAREIHLPFNLRSAARVAVEGIPVKVDVGRVGDAYFLLEVSAGFDAAVVLSVQKPAKRWLGPFAYVFNGLSLLRTYAPFDITCVADGKTIHATCNTVLASNSATYAYGVRLTPGANIHDGKIDLCILHAGKYPLAWQILAAIFNRLGPRVGAHTIQASSIRIESNPPVYVQIDGDPAGMTPLDIECVPAALSLVIPARYARHLPVRTPPAGEAMSP
ncbi:MAG: diacylglycerol kinase family lipid kinase [Armatimonadota bacterium]|nr:diacylglycerol kinase family lipid kinase [Armatimonadota bacterium]